MKVVGRICIIKDRKSYCCLRLTQSISLGPQASCVFVLAFRTMHLYKLLVLIRLHAAQVLHLVHLQHEPLID